VAPDKSKAKTSAGSGQKTKKRLKRS